MGDPYSFCPRYVYTIPILYVICIFGAISQASLLYAFVKDPLKCFRNSGTYLIANLAITDLLTCFEIPLFCRLPTKLLSAMQFISWTSEGVSTFTISSIAFDRFLLVAYPLRHRVLISGKRVVVWSSCIWLICSVVPVKAFFFSQRSVMNSTIIGMNFLQFVLIVLACIVYGFTYHKLRKQSKDFALENVPDRQRQVRVMKEKQFLRTIIVIALIVFLFVVPGSIYYHFMALENFSPSGTGVQILNDICGALFYTNFAVNPLLYVMRLPNYRKTFCLLYCRNRQQER